MDTWTTQEGVTIALSDMTDNHLANAWRYVQRAALVAYGAQDAGQLARRASQLMTLTRELQRRGMDYDQHGYKVVMDYDAELNPITTNDDWGDALSWIDFD